VAKSTGIVLLMVILGGILGGYVGELLGILIPSGILHDIFVTGFPLGLTDPLVINLKVLVIKFGLVIYINLCSVLGIIVALYYTK
jgi:hypothetical protein